MGCGRKQPDEAPTPKETPKKDPPVVLVSGGPSPVIIPPITIEDSRPSGPLRASVRVSVQNPGQKQTDTVNPELPKVFYVIVGRGPAATIDHTTLLQSAWGKDRIDNSPAGKLPVLHIGFSNPWSGFFSHGMGQPTYLLGLPGFHAGNQPDVEGVGAVKDGGLTSTVFGSCVDRELAWCLTQEAERWADAPSRVAALRKSGWPTLNGWVGWIQSKRGLEPLFKPEDIGNEATGVDILKAMNEKLGAEPYPDYAYGVAPYRLLVLRDRDGTMTAEFIYAQYIDFCTGSGRPRQDKKEYKTARLEPWRDPVTWPPELKKRKILVAAEAVRRECDWERGKRVCVANGGAIALNAAERARDEVCWTDWFHVTDLMDSFGNPRNYTFIRHPSEYQAREPGEGKLAEPDLIAADPRTRMGRSTEAEKAVEKPDALEVSLKLGVPRDKKIVVQPPLIRDYRKNESALDEVNKRWPASDWYAGEYNTASRKVLPSIEYDRLIFHTGLVLQELGQPYHSGCKEKLSPIEGNGRMVGLETGDGRVRVLGAAAQMYPELPAFDPKKPGFAPSDQMWQFRSILPVSAVPDGFILSGLNIAEANRFFTGSNKNTNINTMTFEELNSALWDAGVGFLDALNLAEQIIAVRNATNGFSNLDDLETKLIDAARKRADATNSLTVDDLVKKGYEKYLEEVKEMEEAKKILTDPTSQTQIDETLKLMRENEVGRQAGLLTHGATDLAEMKTAETKKAGELAVQFSTNKTAIGKAVKFTY